MRSRAYGGARLLRGLVDIGGASAMFAERMLKRERIVVLRGDHGGECARLLQFWPVEGRARLLTVHTARPGAFDRTAFEAEQRTRAHRPSWSGDGEVELF